MTEQPTRPADRQPNDSGANAADTTGGGLTPPPVDAAATIRQSGLPPFVSLSLSPERYTLGVELARGGMGAVYRATDTAFGREVAVKILLGDARDTDNALRFADEARITAQLQHPNIPAVHDLGLLPDGRPFLAMKLIKGETLDRLLRRRPHFAHDRGRFVAVFEQVCQAVAYAHAHEVVHRDLKPLNVMVGSFGEVQVMDWGLAKVVPPSQTSADGTPKVAAERTEVRAHRPGDDQLTQAGSVLGTPAYMAPEQAIGAVDQVDKRSDVFGLGGILTMVLTGAPPFVSETPESTRQMAARGQVGECFTRLDGSGADPELVALCKRCLSPEQADRPANAEEVAVAVAALRTAADERVRQAEVNATAARVRTAEEQKRRRALTAAGGIVLAVLTIGTAVSIWQAVRATTAEGLTAVQLVKTQEAEKAAVLEANNARAAEAAATTAGALAAQRAQEAKQAEEVAVRRQQEEKKAREQAEEVSLFMREVFAQGSTRGQAGRGQTMNRNLTVKGAMDGAAKSLDRRFAGRPEIEAAVRGTIGTTYRELGAYPEAEVHLTRALALCEKTLGPDHLDTLTSVNNLGSLYSDKGEYGAAEPLHKRALAGREKALGPDHPLTLTSVNNLALLYQRKGEYGAAEPLHKRAVAGQEKALGPDHPETLLSVSNLASLYHHRREYGRAEPLYQRALAGREKAHGLDHPDTLTSVDNLASLYADKGEYGAAEQLYKRALAGREKDLGPDHPDTLASVNNLATVYLDKKEYGAAEPLCKRAVVGREKALGPDHPATLVSVHNQGVLHHAKGELGAAEPLYKRALAGREKILGADHPDTLASAHTLASLFADKGDYGAAEPLFKRALAGREKALGPDHLDTLKTVNRLAILYHSIREDRTAESLFKRALAGQEKAHGPDHPDALNTVHNLAVLYRVKGEYGMAEPLFKRALTGREKIFGADHPDTLASAHDLAVLYRLNGEYAAAEPLLKRALAGREKALGPDHPDTLQSANSLAVLYWGMRRLDRSIPLFEDTVRRSRAKLGDDHVETLRTSANLGVNYKDAGRVAEAVPLLERAYSFHRKDPTLSWVRDQLFDAYVRLDRRRDAAKLMREALAEYRQRVKPGSPELGSLLATIGKALLDLDPVAAEPVLRECLTLREKLAPAAWTTANAKSMVGEALLSQGKTSEAEPLLRDGYAGLLAEAKNIPPQGQNNLPDAVERLIRLSMALGQKDEVKKWRTERKKYPPEMAPPPRGVVGLAPPPREGKAP